MAVRCRLDDSYGEVRSKGISRGDPQIQRRPGAPDKEERVYDFVRTNGEMWCCVRRIDLSFDMKSVLWQNLGAEISEISGTIE